MIAKYGGELIVSYVLYCSLVIVIAGANPINITAIKYIISLKSDVLLAIRQLNCIRQSLHSMMYTLIEGVAPQMIFLKIKVIGPLDVGRFITII